MTHSVEHVAPVSGALARGDPAVLIVGAGPTGLALAGFAAADTRFPFILFVSQAETEALLSSHLTSRGVAIERGVEVSNFVADSQGVDVTLDYRKVDVLKEIKDLTGDGVDVAIEALGTQETFENCLRSLRPGGTLSSISAGTTSSGTTPMRASRSSLRGLADARTSRTRGAPYLNR